MGIRTRFVNEHLIVTELHVYTSNSSVDLVLNVSISLTTSCRFLENNEHHYVKFNVWV